MSLAALSMAGAILARYPLLPWPLGAFLLVYAGVLWRWPGAFLLIVPMALPALNLGLWTGWQMLNETDPLLLVTLAVLLLRAPPAWGDVLRFRGAQWTLPALAAVWLLAIGIGLARPAVDAASVNAFLRPDNALRIGKGLLDALVLLPFLRARQRTHGDAGTLLGAGIALGLVPVTLWVLAEKLLFSSILAVHESYRVAGPFFSMRVGGGHIGAYTALALPFVPCLGAPLRRLAPSGWRPPLMILPLLTGLAGGYTLVVTLARTAYAAGAGGLTVTALAGLFGRGGTGAGRLRGRLPVLLVVAALGVAAAFTGMRERFAETAPDFSTREGNWRAGLAVRDAGLLPTLVGMGLGTYQRLMVERSTVNRPSDVALRDGYVELAVRSPFYLGQKIGVPGPRVHLTLRARAVDRPGGLSVLICDKVLLYSDNCQNASVSLPVVGQWRDIALDLPTAALGAGALGGLLHRPVELSFAATHGRTDLRAVRLTDASGRDLVANGDFTQGLDHWLFTDDSHVSWRILDTTLMLFFETGLLGVLAWYALSGAALLAGLRAASSAVGAGVAGGVTAFLISGLFDNMTEAPRVSALFFLVCACGLFASGLTQDRR